jgi:hypothetical protein
LPARLTPSIAAAVLAAVDSSAAGIFYARFTCKAGSRRVKRTYQQNT